MVLEHWISENETSHRSLEDMMICISKHEHEKYINDKNFENIIYKQKAYFLSNLYNTIIECAIVYFK